MKKTFIGVVSIALAITMASSIMVSSNSYAQEVGENTQTTEVAPATDDTQGTTITNLETGYTVKNLTPEETAAMEKADMEAEKEEEAQLKESMEESQGADPQAIKKAQEAVGVAGIPINSTYFPDAKFRAYVDSSKINKTDDGVLSPEEVAKAIFIDVSALGISSLQGIEYFTSLKDLYCYNNSITTLDISKNIGLTSLLC